MSLHRAALDHVMTLIAESSLAETMVLRGSMTMPAWVGDAARPPGDLDWMIPQPSVPCPDRFDPDPYYDTLRPVQLWPEAVHGAVGNNMWEFEDFDTGGRRPRLPPDGLNWVPEIDPADPEGDIVEDLRRLVIDRPWSPGGIAFAPGEIRSVSDIDYDDYEYDRETRRVRVTLPWQGPDFELGSVQVDVSFGERLPELPVCTAVPRGGGQTPLGLWTPSRELSLAWKLYWLAADQDSVQVSAMKDVYDAVLLAESPGTHLRPHLRRVALGDPSGPGSVVLEPAAIPSWRVDGPAPGGGDPAVWLSRLAAAVSRLL